MKLLTNDKITQISGGACYLDCYQFSNETMVFPEIIKIDAKYCGPDYQDFSKQETFEQLCSESGTGWQLVTFGCASARLC